MYSKNSDSSTNGVKNMKDVARIGGGVLLRVVVAGATLLLIAATVVIVLKGFRNREEINLRKAMAISEYGLFQAMQKLGEQPSWRDGFKKKEYEQGWYTVELVPENAGDTLFLSVVSKGYSGSVHNERVFRLKATISGSDTTWIINFFWEPFSKEFHSPFSYCIVELVSL